MRALQPWLRNSLLQRAVAETSVRPNAMKIQLGKGKEINWSCDAQERAVGLVQESSWDT